MIPLAHAETMISAALAEGAKRGLKPLTVAVLDAGGQLRALARQDGASNLRPELAIGKANGALALGVSSRVIGEMALDRPHFVNALGPMTSQGLVPAAGGLLIADQSGACIGAIGVTGDTSDQDEACALAGIEAAGLSVFSG